MALRFTCLQAPEVAEMAIAPAWAPKNRRRDVRPLEARIHQPVRRGGAVRRTNNVLEAHDVCSMALPGRADVNFLETAWTLTEGQRN